MTNQNKSVFSDVSRWLSLLILGGILLGAVAVSMTIGAYQITLAEIGQVLQAHTFWPEKLPLINQVHSTIVWELRIPRILLTLLVGFALAGSGVAYQGVFRNPLVEPYLLGVSAGGSLGAALGILYPQIFGGVQGGAFVFALLAVGLAYLIAYRRGNVSTLSLILAGIIIGSFFQSLVSALKYISDAEELRAIVFWIMGGFYYASWGDLPLAAPLILGGSLILWLLAWKINVLSLGDDESKSLGINPTFYRFLVLTVATLMVATAVATVGIIAWVGLIIPHIARLLIGQDHRFVFPFASLLGALFLILCDTLARSITTTEIPVGIITSLLSAPFLFYILKTRIKN